MTDFSIGLDLDGVAYEWDKTARYMLRRRIEQKGARVPTELFFPSADWDAIQGMVSPADWGWLWSDAITDGLYRYGHVVQGAIEGVSALANLGDVMVITSRPKAAVNDTIAWIGMMFNRVSLAGIVIQSNGQRKSEVHPTPNVYIDDAPKVADDILDNTASSLVLFDQPWNQKYSAAMGERPGFRELHLFRAKGWPEVVAAVASIKEAGL